MCSERAMEVSWEISDLDPSWAMWQGFWSEISRWTLIRQSRQASGWKMEWKGTQGMRWGFPRKISVGPELDKVEGYVVGNLNVPQLGYVLRVSVGNSGMEPESAI